MAILSGDVKLLKSAVMADVPEGGGAPTGNAIVDGVSNAIFPDISEVARAGGQVSMRKVFASVHTDDTDTYFGANVIVAEPPQDPRVSVTMFSTESVFDTRSQAATRVESYLNKGPEYAGFLYENHIAGQRVIQIFQRPSADIPVVGQTVVLTYNEGLVSEVTQYVRATSISSVVRTFFDAGSASDYEATVVTMEISDALRTDFIGSPSAKSFTRATNSTRIRETTVADAGTYVGVVPLAVEANLGDFTINAESIFTQLVPSAQIETPISDVKTNGLSAALVASGSSLTQVLTLAFTTTQSLYVGGAIYPGSLSIVRSGVTLNDNGGVLENAGNPVGTVDYSNGIVNLYENVFGTGGGSHTVTFTPAATPKAISDQAIIRITPESRSLSYVFTFSNIPTPASLSVSYLAQGRWYTLRDTGGGVIRGTDSAFGVGTISYTTGTVVVTLGALPDVGSAILLASQSGSLIPPTDSVSAAVPTFAAFVNSDGDVSADPGTSVFSPGTVAVSWTNGGAKTASDNNGVFTGDATGTIYYSKGLLEISPTELPPPGTVFTVEFESSGKQTASGVSISSGSLGATGIVEGSVSFTVDVDLEFTWGNHPHPTQAVAAGSETKTSTFAVYDLAGSLILVDKLWPRANKLSTQTQYLEYVIGTVNYTTGVINISDTSVATPVMGDPVGTYAGKATDGPIAYEYRNDGKQISQVEWWRFGGADPSVTDTRTIVITSASVNVSYSVEATSPQSFDATINSYVLRVPIRPNCELSGIRFTLGDKNYVQTANDSLAYDVSPTTGVGTVVGSVTPATGTGVITAWPTNASPITSSLRSVIEPPVAGSTSPFKAYSSFFRVASVPVRPSSFTVAGTMGDGTTAFSVTSDADGKINGDYVKGVIDYEFGLVELYFVNPMVFVEDATVDLSYLGISGVSEVKLDLVQLNTLRYNAVAYSYLPLDADILGIDPVRLPSDGRVPIFRPGGFAVVGHTGEITATVSNAQVIDCARVRLSRVRVIGNDGVVINTGYTADLEAGTVTFTNVSGYSQPVTIQHRIEDMAIVRETQINGEISFTRQLTHDYPVPGSYVSSALIAGGNGDMFARVSVLFDQATWNGTYADVVSGSPATGTFNAAQYPIAVSNRGARTERWVVQFTSGTTFNVIGENVGVIATGSVNSNCAPTNPATSVPYFTIPALGWGSGWSAGNVLRFNTIGAEFPIWVVRTVQQGPETVPDDSFTLLIRGDVNTP